MMKKIIIATSLLFTVPAFANECPDSKLISSDWKMDAMSVNISGKTYSFEQFGHKYNTDNTWNVSFVIEADDLPTASQKLAFGLKTLNFRGASKNGRKYVCEYVPAESVGYAIAYTKR